MTGFALPSRANTASPPLIPLAGLSVAIAIAIIVTSILLTESTPSSTAFDLPAFHLTREEYIEGRHVATFELEWRHRNDWTERLLWTSAGKAPGLTQEVRDGMSTHYNGVSSTSKPIEEQGINVPGVWFRNVVATHPGPRETRDQHGSVVTIRRTTPTDVEEWDGDSTSGIPLGYRQIVNGTLVREFRVVSLVLADGTVIR